MTSYQDLDNAFKLYLDKADSEGTADFLPKERERFLNDAQAMLVTRLLAPRKLTQDVVDNLRILFVDSKSLFTSLSDDQETYKLKLPDDYRRFSRLRVGVESTETHAIYKSSAKMVSQDELNGMLIDVFNKTSIGEPVAYVGGENILVYNDSSYRVNSASLSYYRNAKPLSYTDKLGTELPEELVMPLLEIAVYLAKKSIESPDAQFQAKTLTPLI